jgi:hypothetical protein
MAVQRIRIEIWMIDPSRDVLYDSITIVVGILQCSTLGGGVELEGAEEEDTPNNFSEILAYLYYIIFERNARDVKIINYNTYEII